MHVLINKLLLLREQLHSAVVACSQAHLLLEVRGRLFHVWWWLFDDLLSSEDFGGGEAEGIGDALEVEVEDWVMDGLREDALEESILKKLMYQHLIID